MKQDILNRWNSKFSGSTLPEILIVIILSGILFLLLFEGMNIINKYTLILKSRLIMKSDLFYSHSTLELIMEGTDSIRTSEEKHILLFYKTGEIKYTLSLFDKGIQVLYEDLKDTIFTNNLGWELHATDNNRHKIDSITIIALVDNDTLNLEYGLSTLYHTSIPDKYYANVQQEKESDTR